MKRPSSTSSSSLVVVLLMGLAVAPTSDAFVIPSTSSFDVVSKEVRRTPLHAANTTATATPPSTTPTTFRPRHAAKDWWYNVLSLPQSTVLKEIRSPVLCMATWALVVSCLYKWLPTSISRCLSVSPLAHSFLGSSLSLLLVFRTNSAYQRFQEGRKIWEDILTTARNFTRLLILYRKEIGPARVHRMRHLGAAFPDLLRHHVQSGCLCPSDKDGESIPLEYQVTLMQDATNHYDSESEDETTPTIIPQCTVDRRDLPWSLLPDRTLQQIAAGPNNRPLWICHRLGAEIGSISPENLESRERFQLLAHVDAWTKAIGQCERIHNTATPVHYARHALRGLSLWLGTLPLCLVEQVGWWTAPTTALIAWLLFGVYQIGHSIEDPFQGSLRLSTLCRAIRQDVLRNDRWMDDIDNLEDSLDSLSHTMKAHRQSIFVSKQPEQTATSTTLVPLSAVGASQ